MTAWAMATLFLFALVVQVNDPDPLPWMLAYGIAAAVSAAAALGRLSWLLCTGLAIVSLVWAALLLPGAWGGTSLDEILFSWQMKSPGTEYAREALGLLIVAAWMGLLASAGRRDVRAPRPNDSHSGGLRR